MLCDCSSLQTVNNGQYELIQQPLDICVSIKEIHLVQVIELLIKGKQNALEYSNLFYNESLYFFNFECLNYSNGKQKWSITKMATLQIFCPQSVGIQILGLLIYKQINWNLNKIELCRMRIGNLCERICDTSWYSWSVHTIIYIIMSKRVGIFKPRYPYSNLTQFIPFL